MRRVQSENRRDGQSEKRAEKRTENGRAFRVRNCVTAALLCAVMCVISPFTLPLFGVPITLSLFAVYLCAFLSQSVYFAILPVALYIFVGCFGLPVFSSGMAGLSAVLSPLGGFIIGYIPCVAVISALKGRFGRRRRDDLIAGAVGTAVLYLCGCTWYSAFCEISVFSAISVCVLPFVVPDFLKLLFAARFAEKLTSVSKRK